MAGYASIASFSTGPLLSHKDSGDFISLLSLVTKVRARLDASTSAG